MILNLSLNPLKRVNSILTVSKALLQKSKALSLNPLKRVNSILTLLQSSRLSFLQEPSLNPLKRVNSILTTLNKIGSKFGSARVSIPSNGSIQFLQH